MIRDGNGTRSFETLLRYRGAAMAEFWRALRTLKALQAEQAVAAGPARAAHPPETHPMTPAPWPPLVHRAQPDEPERGAGPRLEYLSREPQAPGRTLHEAAASWLPPAALMPKEPETGRAACGVGARLPNEPEAAPKPTRPEGVESGPSPRLAGVRMNPSAVEVGAGPHAPAGIAAPDASRRGSSA